MSGSTARSDLTGPGVTFGAAFAPPAPGFAPRLPVAFAVDGAVAAPRVLAHRWDPDFTETVYALTDALRLTERKGIRGDVLCADWAYEGAGRVEVRADGRVSAAGLRHSLSGGAPLGDLRERPFADWLARHAPRLTCDSRELAEVYAYRWFVVYRDLGDVLPLQLRELRWMRSPVGVQAKLDGAAWEGDPYTPAIEFGEHHALAMAAARDAALEHVFARGGFDALPSGGRVADDVWHWGMVRSLGGPDLRAAFVRRHAAGGFFRDVGADGLRRDVLGWASALPFLYDDFGPRERKALAQALDAWSAPHGLHSATGNGPGRSAATSWVLHALGSVAARSREPALVEGFARAWMRWTAAHRVLGPPLVAEAFDPLTGHPAGVPDHFSSAWLDTFFRHVLVDGLVDVGPLRVDGVPWKEDEISLERDAPGGPARVTGSRRSSPPR